MIGFPMWLSGCLLRQKRDAPVILMPIGYLAMDLLAIFCMLSVCEYLSRY
jgi:hypothetical protein